MVTTLAWSRTLESPSSSDFFRQSKKDQMTMPSDLMKWCISSGQTQQQPTSRTCSNEAITSIRMRTGERCLGNFIRQLHLLRQPSQAEWAPPSPIGPLKEDFTQISRPLSSMLTILQSKESWYRPYWTSSKAIQPLKARLLYQSLEVSKVSIGYHLQTIIAILQLSLIEPPSL